MTELGLESYPKELFYKKGDTIKTKYTTDSSAGEIDFGQVTRGEENIYISNDLDPKLTKKKIIILDRRLNFNTDRTDKLIQFYEKLRANGFELYYIRSETLQRISNVKHYEYIKSSTENEAYEIAALNGFARDEIYLAGPIGTSILMRDEECYIDASNHLPEINQLLNNLPTEFYKKASIKIHVKIAENFDFCSWSHEIKASVDTITTTTKYFSDLKLFTSLRSLIIDNKEFSIDSDYINFLNTIKNVEVNSIKITFAPHLDATSLSEFLLKTKFTSVKEYIFYYRELDHSLNYNFDIDSLKIFYQNSDKKLKYFLENFTKLKTLSFPYLNSISEDFKNYLPKSLEELCLYRCELDPADLQIIVNSLPKLKRIDFSYYYKILQIPRDFSIPEGVEIIDKYKRFSKKDYQEVFHNKYVQHFYPKYEPLDEKISYECGKKYFVKERREVFDNYEEYIISYSTHPQDFEKYYKTPLYETNIIDKYTAFEKSNNVFLGKLVIEPTKDLCFILPSITDRDELLEIQCIPDLLSYNILICKKSNSYYIHFYEESIQSTCTLYYIIKIPKENIFSLSYWTKNIRSFYKKLNSYQDEIDAKIEKIKNDIKIHSDDYKALMFFTEAKDSGIKTRLVKFDFSEDVEIEEEGSWELMGFDNNIHLPIGFKDQLGEEPTERLKYKDSKRSGDISVNDKSVKIIIFVVKFIATATAAFIGAGTLLYFFGHYLDYLFSILSNYTPKTSLTKLLSDSKAIVNYYREIPSSVSTDQNTGHSSNKLRFTEYFAPNDNYFITPAHYRISVYDSFNLEDVNFKKACSKPEDFNYLEHNYKPNQPIKDLYESYKEDIPNFFLGKKIIPFSRKDQYIALPSLTPKDRVTKIETIPSTKHTLYYCDNANLYYLKIEDQTSPITVNYVFVSTPKFIEFKHDSDIKLNRLHFKPEGRLSDARLYSLDLADQISLLVDYHRAFEERELPYYLLNKRELFNLIMEEQAGVCRHRAQSFVAAAQALGIKARMIINDIHAYVEVYFENEWHPIDLGGGEAETEEIFFNENSVKDTKNFFPPILNALYSVEIYKILLAMATAGASLYLITKTAKYFYNKQQEPLVEATPVAEAPPSSSTLRKTRDTTNEAIQSIITEAPEVNPFLSMCIQTSHARSMAEYIDDLLKQAVDLRRKNILCIMEDSKIEDFFSTMLRIRKDSFVIGDLDEIHLEDIAIEDNKAIRIPSKLANFLKQGKGILCIDWSECKPQHIGFNSINDLERRIEELPIDESVIIFSLLKSSASTSMGEEFYSRQAIKSHLVSTFPAIENQFQITSEALNEDPTWGEINFYTDEWKSQIIGKISIDELGYIYKNPKLLELILKEKRNIILRNAPWEDRVFRLEIKQIQEQGFIEIKGKKYDCKGIKFFRNDIPFSLEGLEIHDYVDTEDYFVVNKRNFNSVFERYHISNSKLIINEEPIRDILLITSDLESGQWAKLAAIKAKLVVQTNEAMQSLIEAGFIGGFNANSAVITNDLTKVITTNDLGFYRETTIQDKKVIYISSTTTFPELIEKVFLRNGVYNHQNSFVADALLNNEDVVIIGNPSKTLLRSLESLFINKPYIMINGKKVPFFGKLLLVSENIEGLKFTQKQHIEISNEDTWKQLESTYNNNQVKDLKDKYEALNSNLNLPLKLNYNQLHSALKRMIIKPNSNPFKHLLRLKPNYRQELKRIVENLWPKHIKETEPKTTRIDKVLSELQVNPLIFIAGPSGAGKSTFIRKELSKDFEIISDISELKKLAQHSASGKPRLLCLDEANIGKNEQYDVLQGIYENPPQILGITIAKGNGIVMLGNYGDFKGRYPIKVVEEHGSIITFKELSDEVMTQNIVLPILNKLLPLDQETLTQSANIFLKAYHQVNKIYPNMELLTPRNLEMICFRNAKLYKDSIKDHKFRDALAIYDEVSTMLKKNERKNFRSWLENELQIGSLKDFKQKLKDSIGDLGFFVPRSRKNLIRFLDYIVAIRQMKIDHNIDAAGINGLLFEGVSGIGKSYLAVKFFESKNIPFTLITPTSFNKVCQILKQCYKNNEIVIIDEINTMPLEPLLNPLLSKDYKTNKECGITLMGTQNPITYPGRTPPSPALKKRFQEINAKQYDQDEIIDLIEYTVQGKALITWIKTITNYYFDAIKQANDKNLPTPNLRQLTDYINEVLLSTTIENTKNEIIKSDQILTSTDQCSADDLPTNVIPGPLPTNVIPEPLPTNVIPAEAGIHKPLVVYGVDNGPNNKEHKQEYTFPPIEKISYFEKTLDYLISKVDKQITFKLFELFYSYDVSTVREVLENLDTQDNKRELIKTSPFSWTEKDFKKLYLFFHPDKQKNSDNTNFHKLREFHDKFVNKDARSDLVKKILSEFTIFAKKFSLWTKGTDILIDLTKVYLRPDANNFIHLGQDSLLMLNKFNPNSKLSLVLPVMASFSVAYELYKIEYSKDSIHAVSKAGTYSIEAFSHYLIDNPAIAYGNTAYMALNLLVVANNLWYKKYWDAVSHFSVSLMVYATPQISIPLITGFYTLKNAYELYTLYHSLNEERRDAFNKILLETPNSNKYSVFEEILNEVYVVDSKELLIKNILREDEKHESFIIPASIRLIDYNSEPKNEVNKSALYQSAEKKISASGVQDFYILTYITVHQESCKQHAYAIDESGIVYDYSNAESNDLSICISGLNLAFKDTIL